MIHYRAYLLTPAGTILSARDLECEDDARALTHAAGLGHPHAVEVWRGVALVGRVPGPDAGDRQAPSPPARPTA